MIARSGKLALIVSAAITSNSLGDNPQNSQLSDASVVHTKVVSSKEPLAYDTLATVAGVAVGGLTLMTFVMGATLGVKYLSDRLSSSRGSYSYEVYSSVPEAWTEKKLRQASRSNNGLCPVGGY